MRIAGDLELAQGGRLGTTTRGAGDAGAVSVAAGNVTISGFTESPGGPGFSSGLVSSSLGSGSGGELSVETGRFALVDGGEVISVSDFSGDAGRVSITAADVLVRNGGGRASVISTAARGSGGSAGGIAIEAQRVRILDGGTLSANTFGAGDAGAIEVTANSIEVAGGDPVNPRQRSSVSALVAGAGSTGNGGDVRLTANTLSIRDGALVTTIVTAGNTGRSGDIALTATELLFIDGSTVATASASTTGGNVDIRVRDLLRLRDASVLTEVLDGDERAGSVFIDPVLTVLQRSEVVADAGGNADGGDLTIVTDHLFADPESTLSASSELGIDGTIEISAPDEDLSGGLTRLDSTFVDPAALLRERCAVRGAAQGRFVVQTDDAVPAADSGWLGGYGDAVPAVPRSGCSTR